VGEHGLLARPEPEDDEVFVLRRWESGDSVDASRRPLEVAALNMLVEQLNREPSFGRLLSGEMAGLAVSHGVELVPGWRSHRLQDRHLI